MSCCWVFLSPCWPWELPSRPRLVSFACTDSVGGWSTHCSVRAFGVISWKTWVYPGTYVEWKSRSERQEDGLHHKMCFKRGKPWCAQFLWEIETSQAQEGVLIWIQRWRFLFAGLEALLGSPFALSTHKDLSVLAAISFWNRSPEEPDPANTSQRELQCPTTACAMQRLQCLTPESEAKPDPN